LDEVLLLGGEGLVALLLELLLELVVGLVVVDVVVGLLLVDELDELLEVLVCAGVVLEQSRAASWFRVVAPWPRLLTNVVLTVDGSAPTSWLKAWAAVTAVPQLWDETAEETELS
jgi:hypothetical protein